MSLGKATRPLYAILRLDLDCAGSIEDRIMVTKTVTDFAFAESEVARLNQLNEDKGCLDFWRATRIRTNLLVGIVDTISTEPGS